MSQNGANKHHSKPYGHDAAQPGQSVPAKRAESEHKLPSPEEDMLIRLGLSQTQLQGNDALKILNSKKPRWQDQVLAIQSLIKYANEPAIAKRIEDYAGDTKEDTKERKKVRIAAIHALGELRKAEYVPREALLRLLWQLDPYKPSDSALYAEVVETLALLGSRDWDDGEKFRQQLVRILSNTKTPSIVRAALIRLFATLGKSAPVKEITALLNETDLDWNVRDAIVKSLDESYTPVFEKLLYDPEQSIRVSAFYRLRKEDALKRILRDLRISHNYVIKDRAAQLLSEVGEGSSEEISVLAKVAQNKTNPVLVRISAILALGQLREHDSHIEEPELLLKHLREDSEMSIRIIAESVTDIFYPPSSSDNAEDD